SSAGAYPFSPARVPTGADPQNKTAMIKATRAGREIVGFVRGAKDMGTESLQDSRNGLTRPKHGSSGTRQENVALWSAQP
ncbi:MAG: hypothetical protein DMG68_04505, partial [Acidobacteria bacterium]